MSIAKYRKEGHEGWWLTNFTMEQVEARITELEAESARFQRLAAGEREKWQSEFDERERLERANDSLRGTIDILTDECSDRELKESELEAERDELSQEWIKSNQKWIEINNDLQYNLATATGLLQKWFDCEMLVGPNVTLELAETTAAFLHPKGATDE